MRALNLRPLTLGRTLLAKLAAVDGVRVQRLHHGSSAQEVALLRGGGFVQQELWVRRVAAVTARPDTQLLLRRSLHTREEEGEEEEERKEGWRKG